MPSARHGGVSHNSLVLDGISWRTYEALLADLDNRPIRLTYDEGCLEITPPLATHERTKKLLGRMIGTLTEELGIAIQSAGSTTFKSKRKLKGLEPDECYYVAREPQVRGKAEIDLERFPPDLAVEVEQTRSALDRMRIYAALGVAEVWRVRGNKVRVWVLGGDGSYAARPSSPSFPFLPMEKLGHFLARRDETDETTWIRSFRAWVRETLATT